MKRRIVIALLIGALSGLAARALVTPTPRTIRILVPALDSPHASPADSMARG
jgi:hypothetical protein